LKERTGLPMARMTHEALEDRLRRLDEETPDRERLLAEMRAISRRVTALAECDPRTNEDIIGDDENGLPNCW
jgi:antitoxin VapB